VLTVCTEFLSGIPGVYSTRLWCKMFKQYRADATAIAADAYELQYSGKVNDIIPVCKYRSRKTGLRIVVAQVQGPLVNGYFCVGMGCVHNPVVI